jgi:hypothetical protein
MLIFIKALTLCVFAGGQIVQHPTGKGFSIYMEREQSSQSSALKMWDTRSHRLRASHEKGEYFRSL